MRQPIQVDIATRETATIDRAGSSLRDPEAVMKVTFLGTGTSRGIPVIGCDCSVCVSKNPKNKRLRTSVLIESTVNVVIDTSADFRQQMLRESVERLDAAVFTHAHVDHILGMDDVFPFNIRSGRDFPIYGSPETLKEIQITFRHLFSENRYPGTPRIELHPISGPFRIGGLEFEPIEVMHGRLPILGYRVGSFGYVTDVSYVPLKSFQKLRGLEHLALGGLRYKPHPTHFSLHQAAETALALKPVQTYLIHLCHDVDHDEGNETLPASVELAFDGLVLESKPR